MLLPRIIPCLLLKENGLVKTVNFKKPIYVGDPLNAIKIFNEKAVDELIFIDIEATVQKRKPPFALLEKIASECFMPVCYGGGIWTIEDIRNIFKLGIEKVSMSSYAVENPSFIRQAAESFGSQSIVVCIDVKKNFLGKYEVVTNNAKKKTGLDPLAHALKMEAMGAGELLINCVDKDGTMSGYDIVLIQKLLKNVKIPLVACGGAGTLADIAEVIHIGNGVSAAAGSFFVFYGKNRAVLISYPDSEELKAILNTPQQLLPPPRI